MKKRLITAFILIILTVCVFVLRQVVDALVFDIALILVIGLGVFEIITVLKKDFNIFMTVLIYLTLAGILPVYIFFGFLGVLVLLISSFAANLILSVFKTSVAFNSIAYYSLILIYPIALMFLFVVLNRVPDYGFFYILLVAAICVFCDSLAFFTGITFKGPKLAPKISPKKTISGAIGGLLGGVLGAMTVYLIFTYIFNVDLSVFKDWHIILVGFVGAIFAEMGDLVESGIKRKLEIKDFSNLLPGHGGVMDRLDSLMFVAFAVFIFSLLF